MPESLSAFDRTTDGSRVRRALTGIVYAPHRLEKEDVFEVLYNPRRRHTLERLAQHDRPHSMDELVERIAAKENDIPIGELERQQRRRVHVSLYQTHLPLLEEIGAIEYDREANRIESGKILRELTPYLDIPATTTVPWRAYYGRLLAGYAGLGVVVLVGLLGAPSLSTLAVAGALLFFALACIHTVVALRRSVTSFSI
ncbi:MAG: hypothetical protein IH933_00660 [Euryarchaeota archaeon]|nr:hypothetical protein [Euryarchaeota archaeon]